MTVAELIAKLQEVDPAMHVVRAGREGGFADTVDIEEIRLRLNVNDTWYLVGPHERVDDDDACDVVAIRV
jgi:hypothetical protein